MPEILIRYVKFLGTSIIGTFVDMLVLFLLSDFVFEKGYWGEYVLSPVLSFQCAVLVNYTIFYFYVWKDRVASLRSLAFFLKSYLTYNISCSTVFLIRLGVLLLIERFTGWDVVVCSILAMCFSGIMNFILTNNLVFRKRK
ncbi:MAG: GtrA family protein [Bacteroidales bacterium]|nr:GtrA family protein [Bacteroidales bacterium]